MIEADHHLDTISSLHRDVVLGTTDTEKMILQYRGVVQHLNQLFDVLYEHTKYKEWTDRFFIGPLTELGVGSCYLATEDADLGIENDVLQQLRIARSQNTPGERIDRTCLHHRKNIGCILGDLKSPICLHFIPEPLLHEMKKTFGTEFTDTFMDTLHAGVKSLTRIQLQSSVDREEIEIESQNISDQIDGLIDQMQGGNNDEVIEPNLLVVV